MDYQRLGDDRSRAGAAARAKFERGRQEHRQRLAPWHPWIMVAAGSGLVGGIVCVLAGQPLAAEVIAVAALTLVAFAIELPQGVLAWGMGAKGEARTADALAPLSAEGFVVLHDRHVPDRKANIDHIVIGPTGVFVIETKNLSGRLRISHDKVYVNRQPRTRETVEQARWEAGIVAGVLAHQLGVRKVGVQPILCVHGARLPFFGATSRKVPIVGSRGLVKLIRKGQPILATDDVMELARIANDRLRSAGSAVSDFEQRSLWELAKPTAEDR